MSFKASLAVGQVGESLIAQWLKGRGWSVLPVYELEIDSGKGPRLFAPNDDLIAPDMLAFKAGNALWIEAKHKTAFSWYRIGGYWVTGIDLRHYEHYIRIDGESPWPVWLMFLHKGGQAKDSPADSPSGLFGHKLAELRLCESHRSLNWGKSGMVYWAYSSLHRLATLAEVQRMQTLPHIAHRHMAAD